MPSGAFSQVKPRQTLHSSHPKTVINRQLQSQKRGLQIALMRADSNYWVRKSRAMKKLYEGREWNTLPDATKYAIEEELLEKLASDRDRKKEELELEWLKKHEEDAIAEDEDDGWIDSENAGDSEDKLEDGSLGATVFDEEEEEWFGIQSNDDNEDDDAISSHPDYVESFIRDVTEIKRKSGEGSMEKMRSIEEKALKKTE